MTLSVYPVSLDTAINPSANDSLNGVGVEHHIEHSWANDAIKAIQAKLGVDGSGTTGSIDFILKNLTPRLAGDIGGTPDIPRLAGTIPGNKIWQGDQHFKSGTPWFDVKAFGAIGDGTTDDTAAILAAIVAAGVGGTVFFPALTYKTTSTLTTTLNNQTWIMNGATISVSHTGKGVVIGSSGTRTQGVVIMGGMIRRSTGTDWTSLSEGVRFQNTIYCAYHDFDIRGFESGLVLMGSNGTGQDYFTGSPRSILACKYHVRLIADGAGSFCNENTLQGNGSLSYVSSDPNATGGQCITCSAVNGADNISGMNGNKFYSLSLENPGVIAGNPSYAVYNEGATNCFIGLRYEGFTAPFIFESSNNTSGGSVYAFGTGLVGPSSVSQFTGRSSILGTQGWYHGGGDGANALITLRDINNVFNTVLAVKSQNGASTLASIDALGNINTANLKIKGPSPWADVKAYGALGDGIADDTAAIQAALNAASWVFVSTGTYRISAALNLNSSQRLMFAPGATIKPLASLTISTVLNINGKTDVTIEGGGILDGDKANNVNKRTSGIWILGSNRVRIRDLTIKNFPAQDPTGINDGDGIYIGRSGGGVVPDDIIIERVTSDANVRQGISLIAGTHVTLRNCTFSNTSGSNPGAGIDIEPNSATLDLVNDVLITGCSIINNNLGISLNGSVQANSVIVISDNTIRTTRSTTIGDGIRIASGNISEVRVENNTIEECTNHGVASYGSINVAVVNNVIRNLVVARTSSLYYCLRLSSSNHFTVMGNKLYTTTAGGAHDPMHMDGSCYSGTVSGNVIDLNGQNLNGIRSDDSDFITISDNTFTSSGNIGTAIYIAHASTGGTGHQISGNTGRSLNQGVNFSAGTTNNEVGSNNWTNATTEIVNSGTGNRYTISKIFSWNPPSVSAGTSVLVPGFAMSGLKAGAAVTIGFSLDLQGMSLTAYAPSDGTVSVLITNPTGGSIDLATGTASLFGKCM